MMFFNSINKFELYLTHKRENISFKFVLAKTLLTLYIRRVAWTCWMDTDRHKQIRFKSILLVILHWTDAHAIKSLCFCQMDLRITLCWSIYFEAGKIFQRKKTLQWQMNYSPRDFQFCLNRRIARTGKLTIYSNFLWRLTAIISISL